MASGRAGAARRERRMLARVSRAAWRLEQAGRERTWALVSARAGGISIRALATAAGLSPSRVHQLVAGAGQVALGDRSSCGLFAQDWTGASDPALPEALQSIQRPASGPGSSPARARLAAS